MSEKTKLKILTTVLGISAAILFFGLSRFSDLFAILGVFCLMWTVFCGIALIDVCAGKRPNLILIGCLMCFIGLGFYVLCQSHDYKIVGVSMSILLASIGFVLVINELLYKMQIKGNKPTSDNQSVKAERCGLCKKIILNPDENSVFVIDGVKYCADCKAKIENEIKNQHTICSICGVDLPLDSMHVIDGKLICHSCFLKKYGDVYSNI